VVKPVNGTLYYSVDGALYLENTYLGTTERGVLYYTFRNCQPGTLYFYPDFGNVDYYLTSEFNCEDKSIMDITDYYDEMYELAVASNIALMISKSSQIRQTAVEITEFCTDKGFECEVASIYDWLLLNIKYIKDPVGQPFLQYPEYTIEIGTGDYDDFTILASSLLESIGIKTKIAVGSDRVYPLVCGLNALNLADYSNDHYRDYYSYYYYDDKQINPGENHAIAFLTVQNTANMYGQAT